ncbi:MAG: hypothetical protein Alpg2KO_15470 [Alphaproteobacteria bacterium]
MADKTPNNDPKAPPASARPSDVQGDASAQATARAAKTHKRVMERLAQAHVELLPTFLKNGTIRAGIGNYRLAEHPDGRVALLFSYHASDLKGATRPAMEGSYPETFERIHVVAARSKRSNRPWVMAAIANHQQELHDTVVEGASLYRTEESVWQSGLVSYKLFEDAENPTNAKGEKQYIVRMYCGRAQLGRFVPVDAPLRVMGMTFSTGDNLGSCTRKQAEEMITRDFHRRVARVSEGKDILTEQEKQANPGLIAVRGAQDLNNYLRRNSPLAIGVDAVSKVMKVLEGPGGWFKAGVDAFRDRIITDEETVARGRDISDRLRKDKSTAYRRHSVMSRLCDPVAIREFRLLEEADAGVRPRNVPLLERLDENWAREWIFSALQGDTGAVVTIRSNGVINVRRPNGLVVDCLPEAKVAYATYRPELAQPNAQTLPSQVQKLVGENKLVEVEMTGGTFRSREVTQASQLTRARRWLTFRSGGKKVDSLELLRLASDRAGREFAAGRSSRGRRFFGYDSLWLNGLEKEQADKDVFDHSPDTPPKADRRKPVAMQGYKVVHSARTELHPALPTDPKPVTKMMP